MSTDSAMKTLPRLVLDTNVVMDLFHFKAPPLTRLAQAITDREVICLANASTLAELERVTGYPQFRLDAAGREDLLQRYCTHLTVVPEPGVGSAELPPLPKCRDPDDQMFLELAQYGQADLLISRDNLVLKLARARQRPCPFGILTPDTALAWLFAGNSSNTATED